MTFPWRLTGSPINISKARRSDNVSGLAKVFLGSGFCFSRSTAALRSSLRGISHGNTPSHQRSGGHFGPGGHQCPGGHFGPSGTGGYFGPGEPRSYPATGGDPYSGTHLDTYPHFRGTAVQARGHH